MIEKLTPEQEQKMPEYFNKWNKIGKEYIPINRENAIPLLKKYLGLADIKPKIFLFLDSPMACQLAINSLRNLSSHLSIQLSSQLDRQLYRQLYRQLSRQLSSQLNSYKLDFFSLEYFYQRGNIGAGYAAFYDFMINEIAKPSDEIMKVWDIFKTITQSLHYFFVFKDFVFISEKPKHLHFLKDTLHNTKGPAVEYKDGYSLYALNGVTVNKEIVETSAEKIDCKIILTEKNAEVRREIVRKVGVERLIVKLGAKSLDKSDNGVYELLDINIGDGRVRPYLKMLNPSIKTWHVEGVGPECKTVEQALKWRNQTEEKPVKLT